MKLKFFLFFMSFLFIYVDGNAQYRRKTGKYSIGAGTFFMEVGYLRSFYANSTANFVGNGYDFTLKGMQAKDIPSGGFPQFNARMGYFFTNNWAIAIGVDGMKYAAKDSSTVLLSGNINAGVDNEWSGNYNNEETFMAKDHFYYANASGQYYIHADALYSLYLFRRDRFALPLYVGLGLGPLVSKNDFTFSGRRDLATTSLSGYGVNASIGFRFEFFNHLFLQLQGDGGLIHQLKVKNRPNTSTATSKQFYFYSALKMNIGFNFYFRPKNACDSCPKW